MKKLQLDYLRPGSMKGRKYEFYSIPKLLVDHEVFDCIDCNAKILFSRMLSRASLSDTKAEKFTDEHGRLYIIYTIEQIMKDMRCSTKTAVKMLKQLDDIGLIEKKKQVRGKPSIIYVKDSLGADFIKQCNMGNSSHELQESEKGNLVLSVEVFGWQYKI